MSSRVLGFKTPFSMFKTYFPTSRLTTDLPLRVFGCSVFVHVHDHNKSKLDPRAKNCVFVWEKSQKKLNFNIPLLGYLLAQVNELLQKKEPEIV